MTLEQGQDRNHMVLGILSLMNECVSCACPLNAMLKDRNPDNAGRTDQYKTRNT